jgi:phosphoribosylformimino-5-aminoimidazole carboxamide ribotide isomerase
VNEGDTQKLVRREFAKDLAAAAGAEHLVFSVDTREGRIAIKGWKQQVELRPETAMAALEPYCAAFLYTHIDREGTMQGFPLDVARKLRDATKRQLIVAGGIREQEEIDALSAMDVDAVAGMAVYLGRLAV